MSDTMTTAVEQLAFQVNLVLEDKIVEVARDVLGDGKPRVFAVRREFTGMSYKVYTATWLATEERPPKTRLGRIELFLIDVDAASRMVEAAKRG